MRVLYARGARVRIQSIRERLAQRVDASSRTRPRLEHGDVVPAACQLVCRRQPGQAGTDDDDAMPLRCGLQDEQSGDRNGGGLQKGSSLHVRRL